MKKVVTLAILAIGMAFSAHAQFGWKSFKWIGNVPIPDGSGTNTGGGAVFAEINVPQDPGGFNEIGDIFIDLIIAHTWQGDLKIWVTGPEGQNVMLIDRPGVPQSTFGFSADNYGNPEDPANPNNKMYLDDLAQHTYDLPHVQSPGIPNVTGFWRPEQSLRAAFLGRSKVGTWRLYAEDFAGGDTGSIRNFSLHVFNVPEPGTLLAIGGGLAVLAARRRRKSN